MFAERLVFLHDTKGLPLEISLMLAVERGVSVPLVQLLAAMSAREWGKSAVRNGVHAWVDAFGDVATPGELRAVASFG